MVSYRLVVSIQNIKPPAQLIDDDAGIPTLDVARQLLCQEGKLCLRPARPQQETDRAHEVVGGAAVKIGGGARKRTGPEPGSGA